MRTWVRRSLWGLAGLIGLPLLLALAWRLLNGIDVPPQPWPPALALPRNELAAELNAHALLEAAPALQGELRLDRCEQEDCLSAWRAQLPKLAGHRAANAGLGAACDATTALPGLRYEDPLPTELRIDNLWIPMRKVAACHTWQLSLALQAAQQGDGGAALQAMERADRLDRAVLAGGRSVIAQQLGASLFGRKLIGLQALAHMPPQPQPDWTARLAAYAALDAAALLARQHDWIRVEASYQRAAADSLRTTHCEKLQGVSTWEHWLCPILGPAAQPEYMTQLVASHWLSALQILQAAPDLPAALPALRERLGAKHPVSAWQRIRHTVPHWLDDIARPVHLVYFEGAADLQLAAEASRLMLEAPAADLAQRASPALRERLSLQDGVWRLRPLREGDAGRMPLAWRQSS